MPALRSRVLHIPVSHVLGRTSRPGSQQDHAELPGLGGSQPGIDSAKHQEVVYAKVWPGGGARSMAYDSVYLLTGELTNIGRGRFDE